MATSQELLKALKEARRVMRRARKELDCRCGAGADYCATCFAQTELGAGIRRISATIKAGA